MADENTPSIDKTPISHVRSNPDRRKSLEFFLSHRPDRQELVDRNILPASSVAPSIIAQQKELEKSMRRDSLNDKLANRPSPEALIKGGVLHEDPRLPADK